jgi:hypothetical protein
MDSGVAKQCQCRHRCCRHWSVGRCERCRARCCGCCRIHSAFWKSELWNRWLSRYPPHYSR